MLARTIPDALSRDTFARLSAGLHALADDGAHKRGRTRWFSWAREPRNQIEAAALALRRYVRPGPSCIGVEYWIRIATIDHPKPLHFDMDVGRWNRDRVAAYPRFASVLYVSGGGASTIVLEQRLRRGKRVPATPPSAVAIEPAPNQLAVFDGDLLHGVAPVGDGAATNGHRITVLVNWWRRRPLSSVCGTRATALDRYLAC
jgi:hypothetical protein